MTQDTLRRIPAKTAIEIAKRFDLTPAGYLDLLVSHKRFTDAVRFLAYALPKREAVWWALLCAREAGGPNSPPPVLAALRAVEAWVRDPTEANRRAAQAAAQAAQVTTPAGCAAMAAFFSGGSLAPPEAPVVPPADHLTAHVAAGAVQLAAVRTEPQHAEEKLAGFITRGVEVANAVQPWKNPEVASR